MAPSIHVTFRHLWRGVFAVWRGGIPSCYLVFVHSDMLTAISPHVYLLLFMCMNVCSSCLVSNCMEKHCSLSSDMGKSSGAEMISFFPSFSSQLNEKNFQIIKLCRFYFRESQTLPFETSSMRKSYFCDERDFCRAKNWLKFTQREVRSMHGKHTKADHISIYIGMKFCMCVYLFLSVCKEASHTTAFLTARLWGTIEARVATRLTPKVAKFLWPWLSFVLGDLFPCMHGWSPSFAPFWRARKGCFDQIITLYWVVFPCLLCLQGVTKRRLIYFRSLSFPFRLLNLNFAAAAFKINDMWNYSIGTAKSILGALQTTVYPKAFISSKWVKEWVMSKICFTQWLINE